MFSLQNDLDNLLADPSQRNDRKKRRKKREKKKDQENGPSSIPIPNILVSPPEENAPKHYTAYMQQEKFEGLQLDPQVDDPNANTGHQTVALNQVQAQEENYDSRIPVETANESMAPHELAQDSLMKSIEQRNPDGIKMAIMGAKEFASIAKTPLFDYNAEALESFEPEKKHSKFGSRLKKTIMYSLFTILFFKIVWENLLQKFGTIKSQEFSTNSTDKFEYSMSEYPLKKFIPVHLFIEMNKEDVVDRMECLVNKNDTLCELYDEKKCALIDKKSNEYEICMLRTYRKYDQEQKSFCIKHYQQSGLYLPSEKSTPDYIESFHSCLQRAGIPKGKKYCDDLLVLDPSSKQQDYFDCYEGHFVNIQEYGEAQCRHLNPPNEGQSTQDEERNIADCMDDNTVSDYDGGTCENWYNSWPDECGYWDDINFKSGEACCICGGGYYPEIVIEDPYVTCLLDIGFKEKAEKQKCDNIEEEYDEHKYRYMCWDYSQYCEDDLSVSDSHGYTCQAFNWYKNFPQSCGDYDTDDFIATNACCVCGGGTIQTQNVPFAGTGDKCNCIGKQCQDQYQTNRYSENDWCWVDEECPGHLTDYEGGPAWVFCSFFSDQGDLQNDNYYRDSRGKDCSEYSDSSECGEYDTDKFEANLMCTICGGGISEVSKYCDKTRNIIKNQKRCYENINQRDNQGYCDTTLNADLSWTRPEQYFECYQGIGLNTSDAHLCDHLYPLDDEKIGGSKELLKCYETFNINLTLDNIEEKCLSAHQENMRNEIDEYSDCLMDFGARRTYDHCWLDPEKVSISIDQRKFIMTDLTFWEIPSPLFRPEIAYAEEFFMWDIPLDGQKEFKSGYKFQDCLTKTDESIKMTAYSSCWQTFESQQYHQPFDESSKDFLRWCFEDYNMPLSPELDCKLKYEPNLDLNYQVTEGLDSSIQENCLWYSNGICRREYSDNDCENYFQNARNSYTYGETNVDPDTLMASLYGKVCQPVKIDYTELNECLENIDPLNFTQKLNEKLKEISQQNSDLTYEKFSNNSEYCDKVFAVSENNTEQTESRFLCYEMVNQTLNPFDYCFEMQLSSNTSMYNYNYFYKYLCLMFRYVDLDSEAYACLDIENLDDRLIKKRNDCLRDYEAEMLPQESTDGSLFIFQSPISILDAEVNLTKVKDKETNFTLSDIDDFLCAQRILATFHSYSHYYDPYTGYKFHELYIKMFCEVYEYANNTRDNLMVHFRFEDYESFENQNGQSDDKNLNNNYLAIEKSEENEQFFNLTFSEDLNLLQVLKNSLYHRKPLCYPNNQIQRLLPRLDCFIENRGDDTYFERLTYNATKLLETYPYIISREMIPNQNLIGQETILTLNAKNATKSLLGIPYEFGPLTQKTIELSKIYEIIKPSKYESLLKQEIPLINTFKINLRMNFETQAKNITYYNILDFASELGGLSASVNTMLASLLGLFLIVFFYTFSSMIKRQNRHKVDHQLVKQNQVVIKEILEEMKESEEEADASQRAATQKEVEELESLLEGEYLKTYADTEERLHQITEKVKKHRPEAAKDVFQYNAKNNRTKWEEIEHRENTEKRALYMKNSQMTLTEIVKKIQQRMHFYSIYQLSDNIEANKIKIRKIKYHTRLQRDQIEELTNKIEKQQDHTDKIEMIEKQQGQIDKLTEKIDELVLTVNHQRAENYDLKEQMKKLHKKVMVIKDIKKFELDQMLENIERHEHNLKDD